MLKEGERDAGTIVINEAAAKASSDGMIRLGKTNQTQRNEVLKR